jgi:putative effector of murein hydrolase LrgA (UPF0299 family)
MTIWKAGSAMALPFLVTISKSVMGIHILFIMINYSNLDLFREMQLEE